MNCIFYQDDGKLLAVALKPIFSKNFKPIAIVGAEMSIAQVRSDFFKLMFSIKETFYERKQIR